MDPEKVYKVEESGLVMKGDRLMAIGIMLPAELKDYFSYSVRLKLID
ncbi:GH36 C-terminal domain-containing protein [Paenibacillus mellifer]|nr:GH36 C-terminal domain-containing protein [Paenibacillus mellifer]